MALKIPSCVLSYLDCQVQSCIYKKIGKLRLLLKGDP